MPKVNYCALNGHDQMSERVSMQEVDCSGV